MKLCHKCNSKMVTVTIVDRYEIHHKALVCTYCGRLFSRDRYFKEV